ncbi:MAG: hypothetical protein JW862_14805 [Anaerolineales bacterium]|nr:hypothetical protein [Anaerolineales bacterium]
MDPSVKIALTQINQELSAVGDRLSAIDFGAGDPMGHWKAIGELSTRVRQAALALPADVLAGCPQLTDFAHATRGLEGCWGSCLDEVQALLAA